jgi:hypothetical protein
MPWLSLKKLLRERRENKLDSISSSKVTCLECGIWTNTQHVRDNLQANSGSVARVHQPPHLGEILGWSPQQYISISVSSSQAQSSDQFGGLIIISGISDKSTTD